MRLPLLALMKRRCFISAATSWSSAEAVRKSIPAGLGPRLIHVFVGDRFGVELLIARFLDGPIVAARRYSRRTCGRPACRTARSRAR